MIIITQPNATEEQIERVVARVREFGLDAQIHPDDRERLYAAVQAAHDPSSDGKFSIEYRIRRSNGEVRWIVGHAQTLFAGEGAQRHPIRTVGAELDVTDRRFAEKRLREMTIFSRLLAFGQVA